MATKTQTKKVRVTAKQVAEHRKKATKDLTPNWEGCESWSGDQFNSFFRHSMDYYRLEADNKSFKPTVVRWMQSVGAAAEDITSVKRLKDIRFNSTMGGIAGCLLRGMQPVRADFNNGKDTAEWLRSAIVEAVKAGKNDIDADEVKEVKSTIPQPSIQDRLKETAAKMTEEIEDAIESFQKDPEAFDPKAFKMLNLLRGKGAKAAHARFIKGFYERDLNELLELASGNADEQLREGYSHRSKKQIRKLIDFYQEIVSACDMLGQEAKVNRKPRAKKPTDKAKVVAKLKYKKQDDALKLVSVNPQDIIGSKELWVYNAKTRKLGKYVAAEFNELGVKGTSVTGFDEVKSVMKTLRKPEEKLKEFKAAGKIQLRKFLDEINATEARMNGRINEEILLLKVQ
jgi:hypothetical protein